MDSKTHFLITALSLPITKPDRQSIRVCWTHTAERMRKCRPTQEPSWRRIARIRRLGRGLHWRDGTQNTVTWPLKQWNGGVGVRLQSCDKITCPGHSLTFGIDWENAVPPEQSSLIFGVAGANLSFNQFSDENNLVIDPRGYNYIIQQEAYTFLKEDDPRLRLNNQITNITYRDDGVTIHSDDGSCVSAAYAICTFSVGVLQNDVVAFEPELPQWKRTSIQKFTMGTYTKIFLQFNETFWPEDTQFFLYASPTKRGWYPVFQSLSTEGFMPSSNIIFVTVVADGSYRVEQQTDEETQEEIMEVLREMYPDVNIPEPTAFMYPRWTKTPWAYGSYSNWPVGTTLEMHQNLRANTGRLWFAGEATSAEYFGFLHGAWFEGREAGYQISSVMQNKCVQVYNNTQFCGETRPHYDKLSGTSPLESYNLLNGWATSSFYSAAEQNAE